jgi:hypothetical protein
MSGIRSTRIGRAFRRAALPLVSYYAVTLAMPLANGAAKSGAFVEHALVVLAAPVIAIILACAVRALFHIVASSHRRLYSLYRLALARSLRSSSAVRLGP